MKRETPRTDATGCDDKTKPAAQKESPKPLRIAGLGDDVRPHAKDRDSRGGWTRTHRRNIFRAKTLRNSVKSSGAKSGALAASTRETEGNTGQSESTHDVRLRRLIAAWSQLPEHIKLAVEALCLQPVFCDIRLNEIAGKERLGEP